MENLFKKTTFSFVNDSLRMIKIAVQISYVKYGLCNSALE